MRHTILASLVLLACLAGALPAWAQIAPANADLIPDLVEKVEESVVQITVKRSATGNLAERGQDFLRGMTQGGNGTYQQRSDTPTSGVIVESDGLILTTFYNVENAEKVFVTLHDGREFEAEVLGWYQSEDIAAIRIEARGLPTLTPATSELKTVDPVAVIGRGPTGNASVTPGIISALDRMSGSAIQTDCDLNFSNNGGALVNMKGELIGIAGFLHHRSQWGYNSGVSFGVPISRLKDKGRYEEIVDGKRVERPPSPYLGVRGAPGAINVEGAMIDEVLEGEAAAAAGLEDKDVIIEYNGVAIKDWQDLVREIRKQAPGDKFSAKVQRGEQAVDVEGILGNRD